MGSGLKEKISYTSLLHGLYGRQNFSMLDYFRPSVCGLKDKLICTGHNSGDYSVSAGYKWLMNNSFRDAVNTIGPSAFPWKDYWRSKVSMRVLMFGWKVICDAVPTKDKLQRHHVYVGLDNLCLFCSQHIETVDHVLLQCSFFRAIWFGLNLGFKTDERFGSSLADWMVFWIHAWKKDKEELYLIWVTVLVTLDTI